jgi:hypothetical protein
MLASSQASMEMYLEGARAVGYRYSLQPSGDCDAANSFVSSVFQYPSYVPRNAGQPSISSWLVLSKFVTSVRSALLSAVQAVSVKTRDAVVVAELDA